jgi:hypothetical protein
MNDSKVWSDENKGTRERGKVERGKRGCGGVLFCGWGEVGLLEEARVGTLAPGSGQWQ